MARRSPPLLAAVLLVLALPGAAGADEIGDAATALREDPVYVDAEARDVLSAAGEQRVEERIRRVDPGPMFVAVLPEPALDEAGGSADGALERLYDELGQQVGTYALIVENGENQTFRAGGRGVLQPGETGALATEAARARGDQGAAAVLTDFVDRVDQARDGDGASGTGGEGDGTGALVVLGVLAAGGGAFVWSRARRRRREEAAQVADLREAARDDLVALGDDVRAIDVDVELEGVDPRAREALGVALERYEQAETALDQARRPDDFEPITHALEEGRWAMEVAKAHLEGREPPERRAPCFFDPRHGPSTRDVEWAPADGQPRLVPACEADAIRVEEGVEPHAREVMVGGTPTPYYMAPAYFGPWAGGFFGGFGGGLLPGMLLGTMLGGSLFGPAVAWGDTGGFGDGGDMGGDLGGGDFGGGLGDFGGGDFGGGDFGGGGDF
jgi:hypothetical protein